MGTPNAAHARECQNVAFASGVRHEGINRFLIGVRTAVSRTEVDERAALPIARLMGGTVSAYHKRPLWAAHTPVCRQIRPEPPARKARLNNAGGRASWGSAIARYSAQGRGCR